jgi:predicted transcriptional regulator
MPTALTDSTSHNNNDSQLQNDSIQSTLLKHIEEYPGLRYRQLLRLTNIVNGVLSYHLKRLEKSNQIRELTEAGARKQDIILSILQTRNLIL